MSEKNTLRTRLVNKHDIEANWLKATNFTPLQGELIVYDVDENYNYERIKMGDGVTNVNELPFVSPQADWNQNDPNAPDYVKNRTHYEEVTYAWQGIKYVKGSFQSGMMCRVWLGDDDTVYKVTFDGQEYFDGLPHTETVDGTTYYSIGDEEYISRPYLIKGTETGYPRFYANDNETHLLEIELGQMSTNLVPLDEKYIPSTIARVSDIPDAIAIDPTLTIEGAAADAKAVGDLWNNIPTDADVWETLINIGLYERLADESGNVLTDEANAILLI